MLEFASTLIATHSGLRGRPGVDLTEPVLTRVVLGFAELLRQQELPATVGIGRDERKEGGALAELVIQVARAAGVDVVDFGVISTPTAKLAARLRGLGGAVVITGSHLEPEWNGLKLVTAPAYGPVDVRKLPVSTAAAGRRRGSLRHDAAAAADHAAAVCASVDAEAVRRARLVVRCTGGAGGAAQLALRQLGCRTPEAGQTGARAGSTSGVDVGLRMDPDGDRLELVDERGADLDPEVTLPLVAIACGARSVVKGADTSRMVDDVMALHGGRVTLVRAGEIHLVETLAKGGGDLAGEGNGGVVRPALGMARDALGAAAAILELRARSQRPLSQLAGELPRYVRRRSTVPCADPEAARLALGALAEAVGVPVPAAEAGVRLERADGSWGLVRQSATEPVLRITAEARTADGAEALHRELRAALQHR